MSTTEPNELALSTLHSSTHSLSAAPFTPRLGTREARDPLEGHAEKL